MLCSLQKDILEEPAASICKTKQNSCKSTRVINGKELGPQTGQLEVVDPREGWRKHLRGKEVRKKCSEEEMRHGKVFEEE
jgi:hypothetical protein